MSEKDIKEDIDCYDCGASFSIKYSFEQEKLVYCPFCGADLPTEEEEDDEENYDDYEEEY